MIVKTSSDTPLMLQYGVTHSTRLIKSVVEGSMSGEIKTLTLQNIERQTPSSDMN